MKKLDNIDRRILRELEANSKITMMVLADRVGLSATPCIRRVRSLEESGIIKRWTIDLDRKALGLNFTVFVFAKVVRHHESGWQSLVDRIQQWEEVVHCLSLSGELDLVLEVSVEDPDAYEEFLFNKLLKEGAITEVSSNFVVREFKEACQRIPST